MKEFLEFVDSLMVIDFIIFYSVKNTIVGEFDLRDCDFNRYDDILEFSDDRGNRVIIPENCEVRKTGFKWEFVIGEITISLMR